MLRIHKISIPTPYPVGPVNTYLLPEEPCTLIDPGPDTGEAREALTQGIKAVGGELRAVKRVVITHFHPDHSGLAGWVREKSGAEIYLQKYEAPKLTGEVDFFQERMPFLVEAGLSEEIIKAVKGDGESQLPRSFLSRADLVTLAGGEELAAGGMTWRVLWLPGHSTGHICLWEPGEGSFIAGDFLLERITPNPVMEKDPQNPAGRAKSLACYLKGLDLIEKLPVKIIWPGHGREFSHYRQVIAAARREHEVRCGDILEILRLGSSLTALQVMYKMYPELKGFQVFMGISEVLGHLDYMLDRGRIKASKRGKVMYYHL